MFVSALFPARTPSGFVDKEMGIWYFICTETLYKYSNKFLHFFTAALAVVITVSVMLGAALRVWAALFERREGSADA